MRKTTWMLLALAASGWLTWLLWPGPALLSERARAQAETHVTDAGASGYLQTTDNAAYANRTSPVDMQPRPGQASMHDAITLALSRYEGKPVDVRERKPKGHEPDVTVHEVRLLTRNGHMLKIRVDAAAGRFLEVDGEGLVEARRR